MDKRLRLHSGHGVAALVGAGIFALADHGGGYALSTYAAVGVAAWWTVFVALLVGVGGFRGWAVTLTFAALTVWTLASAWWAGSAESAYAEFARSGLYLGLLVGVLVLARREHADYWADGLGLGILAVSVVALVSRLFPGSLGSSAGAAYLPALRSRLSYPIGYWNGLGILAALGVPLLLGTAMRTRGSIQRMLAIAGLPFLAAAMYLTSSRGAFGVATVGVVVYVALTPKRGRAVALVVVGALASGLAVLVLASRTALANGRSGDLTTHQGRTAAVLLVLVFLLTAAAVGAVGKVRAPTMRPGRTVVGAAALAVLLIGVAAVFLAHPARRFEDFKRPPPALAVTANDFVQAHLRSGSGSGRWQFWDAAVGEFRSRPVEGRGAGTFGEWWAEHGSLATSIQDAHSLYLETLGELGLVGAVLLGTFLAAALVAVGRAVRQEEEDARAAAAAVGAAFVAYLVAAAVDWMWELPAVTAVAIVAAGLAVRLAPPSRSTTFGRIPRAAAALVTICIVAAEGLPVLTQARIGASQRAARANDTAAALVAARAAIRLEPWAATPYLQLALLDEQSGELPAADVALEQAIARDPGNWQLHLVAARIATERGKISAARRSYERARTLNPRSPLFAASSR